MKENLSKALEPTLKDLGGHKRWPGREL